MDHALLSVLNLENTFHKPCNTNPPLPPTLQATHTHTHTPGLIFVAQCMVTRATTHTNKHARPHTHTHPHQVSSVWHSAWSHVQPHTQTNMPTNTHRPHKHTHIQAHTHTSTRTHTHRYTRSDLNGRVHGHREHANPVKGPWEATCSLFSEKKYFLNGRFFCCSLRRGFYLHPLQAHK